MPTGIYPRTTKHNQSISRGIRKTLASPRGVEWRKKLSEKRKGKPGNALGKHWKLSRKAKENHSKSLMGKKLSEETKRKLREARLLQRFDKKDTKIERKIEQELQRRNVYYQKQVPLCKTTIVDFYLPQGRTVIYCDGDYWHSTKRVKDRDINQDVILAFNGFNVYRFTETEINKSPKRCINKILRGYNEF